MCNFVPCKQINYFKNMTNYPKIGIRPTIDGRQGGIREGLEEKTMNLAKAVKCLIEENLKNGDGSPVECVISNTTIGRVGESAACAEQFEREGVGSTITVTSCWCYGSETMDMNPYYVSPEGNGRLNGSKVFTVPGTHVLGDGTNAAGTLTRWVRDLLYAPELSAEAAGGENAYAVMAREAARVPRGADGLMMLPYIYGERSPLQDPQAVGLLFGLRGSHGRAHINRAALEAVGYSTLQHLALFRELGLPPRRIITAGGGTKNRTWMQIVCDICGLPITIPESWQCSAFGDAMLAALGAGRLADFSDLRRALPRGTVLEPDEAAHAFYAARYPLFRDLYLDNRDKMHALAAQL